jgi:hypothetical protein
MKGQNRAAYAAFAICAAASWIEPAAGAPPPAKPDKKACFQAHEQGQVARSDRKLILAAKHFALCAEAACPKEASVECVTWLAEVRGAIPTIKMVVFDLAGHETQDVKVLLDGEPFANKIEAKSYEVDPGQHTLQFELADGKSMQETFTVGPGESNTRITVDFSKLVKTQANPASVPAASAPAGGKESPPAASKGPVPLSSWILGGLGLVALGSFAAFASIGKSKEKDLMGSCAPKCEETEVVKMERSYLMADISLGVGVVAVGAAAVLFFTRKPREDSTATNKLEVLPGLGSGMLRWTARF